MCKKKKREGGLGEDGGRKGTRGEETNRRWRLLESMLKPNSPFERLRPSFGCAHRTERKGRRREDF